MMDNMENIEKSPGKSRRSWIAGSRFLSAALLWEAR